MIVPYPEHFLFFLLSNCTCLMSAYWSRIGRSSSSLADPGMHPRNSLYSSGASGFLTEFVSDV